VGLKFKQEAQEANFRWALRMHRLGSELPRPVKSHNPIDVDRYGLVRVRENAESIAFYGGERSEERLLARRLGAAIANYAELLIASRNLQFFTSFYRQAPSPDQPRHMNVYFSHATWNGAPRSPTTRSC